MGGGGKTNWVGHDPRTREIFASRSDDSKGTLNSRPVETLLATSMVLEGSCNCTQRRKRNVVSKPGSTLMKNSANTSCPGDK